ncbi:MCP methyltransferase, CheR-type [Magnetococcus marinus MC-1]|uniref:MCP methyltransferase, CheR-type n=1 Tax=Magnetococcus marinus (strain ATCC BAA-1437 / JCM 17883 / MC-1) TaxID=156889 RepID=A0L8P6_MAGMM|nr:CheR family methyltransferase [Magnetococcus marinus]ABK44339.1 MCP methyltransferase, CheR-type [Magnetococcus marinus MC-1]
MATALADDERALAQLVRQRLGITVRDHQILPFRRGIQQTLDRFGLSSYAALTDLIRHASGNDPIMESLVAGVTVGESYFYRDPLQISFLENRFLTPLLKQRKALGHPALRIWSAGCSDGQELYTLMLILDRLIPKHETWQVHALGTDINKEALARAQQGRYGDWAMRGLPDALKQSFFSQDGNYWQLQTHRFRAQIKFDYLNLIEGGYPSILQGTGQQDLILCRNVFIYFDNPTVDAIVARFSRCLNPGGLLITGACDYVPNHIPGLVYRHEGGVFFFEKVEATGALNSTSLITQSQPARPSQAALEPPKLALSRGQTKPATPYVASPPAGYVAPSITNPHPPLVAGEALPTDLELQKLLIEGQFSTVVTRTERLPSTCPDRFFLQRAQALTALGQWQAAQELLQLFLKDHGMNDEAHFLLALVFLEKKDEKGAEEELRKTMMLNRDHLMSHFHMGFLKIGQGRAEAGERLLRRALELANRHAQSQTLLDPVAGLTILDVRAQLAGYLERDRVPL